MTTRAHASPERAQRDELERLQDECRETRQRRDDLSRENAEEEESRTVAERPASSPS